MNRIKDAFGSFQNQSLKRKIIIVVVIGFILFLVSGTLFGSRQQQYATETVKRGTIEDTVSESGNIQSNQTSVYSYATGVIQEIYVANNDSVKAGDKLFKVKATATESEKAEAWANYQSAVSSLKTAEQNKIAAQSQLEQDRKAIIDASTNVTTMQDNRNVGKPNPSTNKSYTSGEIESIKSALTSAQYTFSKDEKKYLESDVAIASAKASVDSNWIKYKATQDSIVTASVDGIIGNLAYGIGENVTAKTSSETTSSTTTTTASPVLVIGTSSEYVVKIELNEVNINKIQVDQPAAITIDAIKGKKFAGKVIRSDEYGTNTSEVISYNVYIKLLDTDPSIKPLMSANVSIQTTKNDHALLVPNSAIKPYKGGKAVQVVDNNQKEPNKIKFVPVTIGIKSTTHTEILDGITEGTTIITSTSSTTSKKGGLFPGLPGN